jgi:enoyl-[acyl-carrier protein] reductase I
MNKILAEDHLDISEQRKLMEGKRGIIMGIANEHSLAFGIARALSFAGAELIYTSQNDMFLKRIKPIGETLSQMSKMPHPLFIECDVSKEGHIEKLFEEVQKTYSSIDFVVHSLAFSDKNELKGRYIDTTKANFLNSLNISCYSFTETAKFASKIMEKGSLLTLSYYGAEKVMPNYNVMGVAKAALEASVRYLSMDLGKQGIRVNALSAGPVKTLASSGISDFRYILKWNQYNSPLRRTVTLDDIGGSALYLLSHLSSGVTGEVHHVDCGYHVVGMKAADAPDISVVD